MCSYIKILVFIVSILKKSIKNLLMPLLLIIASTTAHSHGDNDNDDDDYLSDNGTFIEKLKSRLSAESVPKKSQGPDITAKGYHVEEIKDGAFWVTDGGYTTLFFSTGEGVVLVDAPPSFGENLLTAIAEVTNEPITHLIYSHSHRDHIGGVSFIPGDYEIIAHELTYAQLKRAAIVQMPLPTITFSEEYKLKVGDKTIDLSYKGPQHESGNIYIYSRDQKVLMLADVITPGWVPFKNLVWTEDVPNFIKAHSDVLSYDFETFIGGHLNRPGNRKDVMKAQEYVLDVINNSGMALQGSGLNVEDLYKIAQEIGTENVWRVFDTFLDVVAEECEKNTLKKWNNKLGGADVFTEDNCWTMGQFLRVD